MSEIFAVKDLITGLFGGVIGALLAYLFGVRQLRKGIEQQAAQAFIDTHFLPLHGALGVVAFASLVSKKAHDLISCPNQWAWTKEDADGFLKRALGVLNSSIEQVIHSGAYLLLYKIRHEAAESILFLHARLKEISPEDVVPVLTNPNSPIVLELKKLMEQIEAISPKEIEHRYIKTFKEKTPIIWVE